MKFYQKKKQLSMWITAFIFVALVIIFKELISAFPIVLSVIGNFVSILSPFIIGFIIAFLLFLPCSKIETLLKKLKKPKFIGKHARGISVLAVYIISVAVIAVLLSLIIPWVVKNLIEIYNNRTVYYNIIVDFINSKCGDDGKIFGIDPVPLYSYINPETYLKGIDISKLTTVANGAYKFGLALVDVVLAVFSSIYMLISRESVVRSIGRIFTLFASKKSVLSAYDYLCKISKIFYSYIYSALIDAFVVAISCTAAFFVIGVDYAPLFGLLVGLSNLIPYFGAIIAGVGVSVFTLVTDGFIPAIIVAVVVLVIQQVDCNIIQPRIVGHTVGIPPLLTLIAITLGGGLMGFWGILIGVPIAASIQMIVNDIIIHHEQKVLAESVDQTLDEITLPENTETK
jgi:predicted PurR-regulated permease PerM